MRIMFCLYLALILTGLVDPSRIPELANAIIRRHQAGVPVRIIVEPRANLKFPMNQPLLDQFRAAGIPMRFKLEEGGIVHIKVLLVAGCPASWRSVLDARVNSLTRLRSISAGSRRRLGSPFSRTRSCARRRRSPAVSNFRSSAFLRCAS